MAAVAEPTCCLAEWYLPELTESLVAAAAAMTDEGTPVQLLVTLSVPTDEVLYAVICAQSRDIVSRTCIEAGAPHQRLSDDIGTRIRQGHP
jgi:hypothetical protein